MTEPIKLPPLPETLAWAAVNEPLAKAVQAYARAAIEPYAKSIAELEAHNEHIVEVFKNELEATAAVEAALQSQVMEDAERYRWIRDPCSGADRVILYSRGDYGKGLISGEMLDEAIDHARRIEGDGE